MQFPELLLSPFASLERIFRGWEFMVRLQHGIHRARDAFLFHHLWQRWQVQGWKSHQVCGELLELQLARSWWHLCSPAHLQAGQSHWTCLDLWCPAFESQKQAFFKGQTECGLFFNTFIHLSLLPSCHLHSSEQVEIRDWLLGKCKAGIESSRVVSPAAPGAGSTASKHCRNTPGVSLQLWRDTS